MKIAFYGKTIENVYNRQHIKLLNYFGRYVKLVPRILILNRLLNLMRTKVRGKVKLDKLMRQEMIVLKNIWREIE